MLKFVHIVVDLWCFQKSKKIQNISKKGLTNKMRRDIISTDRQTDRQGVLCNVALCFAVSKFNIFMHHT